MKALEDAIEAKAAKLADRCFKPEFRAPAKAMMMRLMREHIAARLVRDACDGALLATEDEFDELGAVTDPSYVRIGGK